MVMNVDEGINVLMDEWDANRRKRCTGAAKSIISGVFVWACEDYVRRRRYCETSDRLMEPRPTTPRRVYAVACKCGHIVLGHTSKGTYREEYQAEIYAHDALQRQQIQVPEKCTEEGKRCVAQKIHQAVVKGAKEIDPEALAWCKEFLSDEVRNWLRERGQEC